MKTFAIIPSGGSGKRIGSELPKQYLQFNNKELIAYTIEVFQNCESIDEIIVPAKKEFFELLNNIKTKYSFSKLTRIIEGGSERQFSVANALAAVKAHDDDIVVVHDGVRPLLNQNILKNSIQYAIEYGSAVVAIKAKDTLINGTDTVLSYIDRQEIYYAQTPQTFRYKILMDAIQKAQKENFIGTDESMLVYRAGYEIKIVDGSSINIKITSPDDIELFSKLCDYK